MEIWENFWYWCQIFLCSNTPKRSPVALEPLTKIEKLMLLKVCSFNFQFYHGMNFWRCFPTEIIKKAISKGSLLLRRFEHFWHIWTPVPLLKLWFSQKLRYFEYFAGNVELLFNRIQKLKSKKLHKTYSHLIVVIEK